MGFEMRNGELRFGMIKKEGIIIKGGRGYG